MKYLDKVKLINDKNYVNLGLKCGRIGRIISAEIRDDELSNAITTVQKDSLVLENFTNPQAGKILPVGKL